MTTSDKTTQELSLTIPQMLKNKTTLSFEVFPPKEGVSFDGVRETVSRLSTFKPDFFSCTYGAGGTNRERSFQLCDLVRESGNPVLAHLTCIGSRKGEIAEIVRGHIDNNIMNVLALRGDFPAGQAHSGGDFAHADELTGFLKKEFPRLCIGAAGYPEKHIQAESLDSDIAALRSKQDSGAEFVMTQLCYNVSAFAEYLKRIRKAGVTIPVVAGIMPAFAYEQTIKMTLFNGCSIPAELAALLGKHRDDPDGLGAVGIEYTARLMRRFVEAGADGLHVYSMNKWKKVSAVMEVFAAV